MLLREFDAGSEEQIVWTMFNEVKLTAFIFIFRNKIVLTKKATYNLSLFSDKSNVNTQYAICII